MSRSRIENLDRADFLDFGSRLARTFARNKRFRLTARRPREGRRSKADWLLHCRRGCAWRVAHDAPVRTQSLTAHPRSTMGCGQSLPPGLSILNLPRPGPQAASRRVDLARCWQTQRLSILPEAPCSSGSRQFEESRQPVPDNSLGLLDYPFEQVLARRNVMN